MIRGRYILAGVLGVAGLVGAASSVHWRSVAVAEMPGSAALNGVPLIKAETTPIKVKPKDPGGLKIPHREASIYKNIETQRKVMPAGAPAKSLKKARQPGNAKSSDKKKEQAAGPFKIQLGSFVTQEAAQRHWQALRARNGELGSLQMVLTRVTVPGKGTRVRLQAGPLKTAEDVQKTCAALAKRNVGCIPVRS